jgi:hypothetical protein
MSKDKDKNTGASSALTETKPLYARIVMLLLAFNFIVNGYVLYQLTDMQTEDVGDQSAVTTSVTTGSDN